MKKLVTIFLITMVLLISVYASPPQEVLPYFDSDGWELWHFIAHAKGTTYIIYSDVSDITNERYYYLGKIKNDKIVEIGEIDELTGVYSTKDDYKVTGMVQLNGQIYVSKASLLYRLTDDNKLKNIPFHTPNNIEVKFSKYHVIIGKLTADEKRLYAHFRTDQNIVTAYKDDIFDTPVDEAVFGIEEDGQLYDTGFHLQKHYATESPDFSMDGDDIFFEFSDGLSLGPDKVVGIHKYGENQENAYQFNPGDLTGVTERRTNVLVYNGKKLTYRLPFFKDYIEVVEVKEDKYYRKRNNWRVGGIYTVTTKNLFKVEGSHFIKHWTVGDDGYVYMITERGMKQNNALMEGYTAYKFKL